MQAEVDMQWSEKQQTTNWENWNFSNFLLGIL